MFKKFAHELSRPDVKKHLKEYLRTEKLVGSQRSSSLKSSYSDASSISDSEASANVLLGSEEDYRRFARESFDKAMDCFHQEHLGRYIAKRHVIELVGEESEEGKQISEELEAIKMNLDIGGIEEDGYVRRQFSLDISFLTRIMFEQ